MEASTFLKVFLGCAALVMALEISYLVRSRAYADPGGSPVHSDTLSAAHQSAGTAANRGFDIQPSDVDGCTVDSQSLLADSGLDAQDSASVQDCDDAN